MKGYIRGYMVYTGYTRYIGYTLYTGLLVFHYYENEHLIRKIPYFLLSFILTSKFKKLFFE